MVEDQAGGSRPSVYTLPFGHDLCDETASFALNICGSDPLAISDATIFLPNNRAIAAMREAFVRRAAPGLLMPRLVAIGDLALDESLGPLLDPFENAEDANLPSLIPPLQRQLILAQMISDQRRRDGQNVDATEAMRLARLLAGLIDELDIEQKTIGDFQALSGEREISEDPDLAGHWQASYAGLLEILPLYRAKMAELRMDGPAARRNFLLGQLKKRLSENPPSQPIFASGISTAAPAIAEILKVIASLPMGHVILPPVDLKISDEDWHRLGMIGAVDEEKTVSAKENHPQFHLKLLLERMGVDRAEIQNIASGEKAEAAAIGQVFCLPAASTHWKSLPDDMKSLPHLRLVTAEDSAEEARAVAVLVRKALEQAETRIAIVTPDRELAGRISLQLERWGIHVDDTAGMSLLQTPPGTLLLALLGAVADRFSPTSILAVAKHPLVHAGEGRLDWLTMSRALDLQLRGPSDGVGIAAITRLLLHQAKAQKTDDRCDAIHKIAEWWNGFTGDLEALDGPVAGGFLAVLTALVSAASALSDNAIWRGAAGRQLSALFESFALQDFTQIGSVQREALPDLFRELCHGEVVRPPYGGHPRVALLGLLEARLQQADIMICAGLNEGSWPQLPTPDPWLAPRIRRQLGLPGLERNIGLAAHDLSVALGARETIITRAKRDRAGPTVSSRFLLRIEAFLGDNLQGEDEALLNARALDRTEKVDFAAPPQIRPSAKQRRVNMSVTNFDRLLADPFAFYGAKILRVGPLDQVDQDPGPAWRGTKIHDLLEIWAKEDACDPDKLMHRAKEMLSDPSLHPNLRAMWQPRITAALEWVGQESAALYADGRVLSEAEITGHFEIDGIKISGRADRIDRTEAGDLIIIDYKTGKAPAPKQIRAGYALQLGLMGHMAEQGKFKGVSGTAKGFEYWSFSKERESFGKRVQAAGGNGDKAIPAEDFVPISFDWAQQAIANWITGNAPFEAKLHPEFAPYGDFDQLSRLQEWDGRQSVKKGEDS